MFVSQTDASLFSKDDQLRPDNSVDEFKKIIIPLQVNMKVFVGTSILFILGSTTDAFSGAKAFGTPRVQEMVSMKATGSAEGSTSEVGYSAVRKAITQLNKENFSDTLAMVEPFLLDKAGATFYSKSVSRIKRSAKALGVNMPADFAKEAKATTKRRERQDAFIQKKIEEAKAAAEAESTEEEVTA